ncbi:MAG TPA: ATP-binding protein [Anaerolineaceae bacterium]|nr:ATP-binding protein [Anaerolineaceae bacterium]
MSTTPPITSRPLFWKAKEPGLDELSNLLNFFPEAALLLDRTKNTIVYANSAVLKLTAFGTNELNGKPIKALLPDLEGVYLEAGATRVLNVLRSKRSPLAVQLQVSSLDNNGRWALVILAPSQRLAQSAWQEKAFLGFRELSSIADDASPYNYLNRAIDIIQEIVDAELVCVYHDFPNIIKLAARENPPVFPVSITTTDLGQLSSFTLWNPGKRVQTDIHRAARLADVNYVASIPLGTDSTVTGLLVVADFEKQPAPYLASLLAVFGSLISNALQHFILVETQRNEINQKSGQVKVLEAFIDNAQEGIILLQPDLRISDMNPTAEKLLEYGRLEVKGELVDKILIGSEGLFSALEAASRGVSTFNTGNSFLNKRYGNTFAAQIQTIPVLADSQVQAILVYILDITEYEEFRAKTQQLEQRAVLGQFSAMIAHEIRNPINNIYLNLQYISRCLDTDDPTQESIKAMQRDCERLSDMVGQILTYSNLETSFTSVNLKEIITYQYNLWRPKFATLNVTPTFKIAENVPNIWGDPRSLEQVFANLISNAVDAMAGPGGTLAINVNLNNTIEGVNQVEITVSDSGPGIPDEIRDHIFEPFVTFNKRGGTGLGLAITKQIITAHHGSITVKSYPGVTIFTVLLMADRKDNLNPENTDGIHNPGG